MNGELKELLDETVADLAEPDVCAACGQDADRRDGFKWLVCVDCERQALEAYAVAGGSA